MLDLNCDADNFSSSFSILILRIMRRWWENFSNFLLFFTQNNEEMMRSCQSLHCSISCHATRYKVLIHFINAKGHLLFLTSKKEILSPTWSTKTFFPFIFTLFYRSHTNIYAFTTCNIFSSHLTQCFMVILAQIDCIPSSPSSHLRV